MGALAVFATPLFAQDAANSAATIAQDAANPAARDTACVTPITACGCVITKPGVYQIANNLSSSQGLTSKSDCLDIKASGVVLDMGSNEIAGPGGSNPDVGIRVLQGSINDTLAGGATFPLIDGWGVGLLISGKNGVYSNIASSNNAFAGFEIMSGNASANNNKLIDWDAINDGTFGLWIRSGLNTLLTEGFAAGNTTAGIFVGCSKTGVSGQSCKGATKSAFTDIIDVETDSNTFGTVLDKGSTNNVINDIGAHGNTTDDLFDNNSSCDSNAWFGNSFGTSSPASCIH